VAHFRTHVKIHVTNHRHIYCDLTLAVGTVLLNLPDGAFVQVRNSPERFSDHLWSHSGELGLDLCVCVCVCVCVSVLYVSVVCVEL
jgi:hypothetical protein